MVKGKPFYLDAGNYVEISVYDNGCGIPEKNLYRIFKPFYSTRIKNEGVGLGLFIAYNIVNDMNGQIYVDSRLGEFTEIFIYLPVKEEKLMELNAKPKKGIFMEGKQTHPAVLIVDDEYNIRSMMQEIMEVYNLKVYTAGNGREGVGVFQQHQSEIDLVILDMVMPVMDGPATFDEIRKMNPEQKIFIISGYSQREDLEEMLRKGAVGFMRKPFQLKEIVNQIKKVLNLKD